MLILDYTNEFNKDYKKMEKRNYNMDKLNHVIQLLLIQEKLPARYREHYLTSNYKNLRECNISPN